ncbi:MAG: hypothetical protein WCP08_00760 [Prolixibacteraceae bacterium]
MYFYVKEFICTGFGRNRVNFPGLPVFPYFCLTAMVWMEKNKPVRKLLSRRLIPFDLVVASHNRFGSFGTTLGYDNAFQRFLLFY